MMQQSSVTCADSIQSGLSQQTSPGQLKPLLKTLSNAASESRKCLKLCHRKHKEIPSEEVKGTSIPVENGRHRTEDEDFPHYKRVGDYLLGTSIGEGAFAKVRVGLHHPTKEKVAIKVINKTKAKKDSYVFKNLHREGKIMQMLRHPNIVQIFDIMETGNNYYLVHELCEGGELIDIVTEQGSLPEEQVRKYIYQLVIAVAYMHHRKVVHRDLKVENLLLDSHDNLKIIDFGLSNVLPEIYSDISCALATQCGSPAYAAPELLSKKLYGPKVDVWSIGVITYALLVGKLPFTADPFHIPKLCKKMMKGDMNPIPSHLSSQCRAFIRKLLVSDHAIRPSIEEVLELKWISQERKRLSKTSVPSSLLNRLAGEASPHRRSRSLIALSSSPVIDSSIVKEMRASYGFSSTDVIKSVHNNRPGPVLATYCLLYNRKRFKSLKNTTMDKLAGRPSVNIRQNVQEFRQKTANTLKETLESTDRSSTSESQSSFSSQGNFTVTPQLPNIRTPECSELSDDDIMQSLQETKHPKMQTLPGENRVSNQSRDLNQNKYITIAVKPLTNFHLETLQISPSEDQSNSYTTKSPAPMQDISQEKLKRRSRLKEFNHSQSNEDVSQTNKSFDLKDLLVSMKTTRKVLENRQKTPQCKRFTSRENDPINKPFEYQQTHTEESKYQSRSEKKKQNFVQETSTSPRRHVNLKPLNKVSVPPRSVSQQGYRQREKLTINTFSPSRNNRPASQNTILPEIQMSPFFTKRTSDKGSVISATRSEQVTTKFYEKTKNNSQSPQHIQGNKLSPPSTLPILVTKTNSPEKLTRKQTKIHSLHSNEPTTARGSLPDSLTSMKLTNKTKDTSLNAAEKRLLIPPIWQNNYNSKAAELPSKIKSGYEKGVNQAETLPRTQRPKKIISEPIAAAISYLTSTKNRTFRKEKAT